MEIVQIRTLSSLEKLGLFLAVLFSFPVAILVFIGSTALSVLVSIWFNLIEMLRFPNDVRMSFLLKRGAAEMRKNPWPNNLLDN